MTDFTIASDEHSADIEVQGENTRERMKAVLDALTPELNGEVDYMRVQLRTTGKDDNSAPEQPAPVDTEGGPNGELPPRENVDGGGHVGKMADVPERGPRTQTGSNERLGEDDREVGDIIEGSSHHVVASLLHELGETRPADLQERLSEMPTGTLSGALQQLWQRKLADRSDQEHNDARDGGGSVAHYWLTDRGEDFVAEHGTFSETEWAE